MQSYDIKWYDTVSKTVTVEQEQMSGIRTIEQLACSMIVIKYSFYREKISLLKESISTLPAIIVSINQAN